jgi:hypothetical protein
LHIALIFLVVTWWNEPLFNGDTVHLFLENRRNVLYVFILLSKKDHRIQDRGNNTSISSLSCTGCTYMYLELFSLCPIPPTFLSKFILPKLHTLFTHLFKKFISSSKTYRIEYVAYDLNFSVATSLFPPKHQDCVYIW